jgi:hypothetical protein
MNEQTPAQPTALPAVPLQPSKHPNLLQPSMSAELTAAEAAKMTEWVAADLKAGKISPEVAERAFADLGTSTSEQMKPDPRTPEQVALDRDFPPAAKSDFIINWGLPASPELKAADESARTWLSAAGFDQQLGDSLVNTIEQVSRQTRNMTPQQLENWAHAEFQKVQGVYGADLDAKLNAAGTMIDAIDCQRPGLKKMLLSQGIGDSSLVSNLLIAQAERWAIRRKK